MMVMSMGTGTGDSSTCLRGTQRYWSCVSNVMDCSVSMLIPGHIYLV